MEKRQILLLIICIKHKKNLLTLIGIWIFQGTFFHLLFFSAAVFDKYQVSDSTFLSVGPPSFHPLLLYLTGHLSFHFSATDMPRAANLKIGQTRFLDFSRPFMMNRQLSVRIAIWSSILCVSSLFKFSFFLSRPLYLFDLSEVEQTWRSWQKALWASCQLLRDIFVVVAQWHKESNHM